MYSISAFLKSLLNLTSYFDFFLASSSKNGAISLVIFDCVSIVKLALIILFLGSF